MYSSPLFQCRLLLHLLHFGVDDANLLHRFVFLVRLDAANSEDDIEAGSVEDDTEDGVPAVQPGRRHQGDEELTAIGVLAGVGHAQHARLTVVQHKVLILKALSVDGEGAPAIAAGDVAALDHEGGNHPVEGAVLVGLALEARLRGEHGEIFHSFWSDLSKKANHQLGSGGAVIANLHGERHFVGHINVVRLGWKSTKGKRFR